MKNKIQLYYLVCEVCVSNHILKGGPRHGLPHQDVLGVLPLLPEHPPAAGAQVPCEVHDGVAETEIVVVQLGENVRPVLSHCIGLGHLYNLVHQLVRHEELVEVIGGVAVLGQLLHGLVLQVRHSHPKDAGQTIMPHPLHILLSGQLLRLLSPNILVLIISIAVALQRPLLLAGQPSEGTGKGKAGTRRIIIILQT